MDKVTKQGTKNSKMLKVCLVYLGLTQKKLTHFFSQKILAAVSGGMFASSNIRSKLNIKWNSNEAMLECMDNDELRLSLIKYAATKVNLSSPQTKLSV